VRSIGVSNLDVEQVRTLCARPGVLPAVNQVELHPWFPRERLRAHHREHGIVTEAWRPLAKGRVLEHPEIVRLAAAYGRTPAQVVLRWHLQLGIAVLPKSVTPERIRENLDLGFELEPAGMETISALEADP
jgi:2,5-diketo-D-gluconate reductase A